MSCLDVWCQTPEVDKGHKGGGMRALVARGALDSVHKL